MAKLDEKIVQSAIERRLLDDKIKENCLKDIAALEEVIRKTILQLNEMQESKLAFNDLTYLCYYEFFNVQAITNIYYGKQLSEEEMNKYIAVYIQRIGFLFAKGVTKQQPFIELEIDFEKLVNCIQKILSRNQQRILECGLDLLEGAINNGIKDYYHENDNNRDIHKNKDIKKQLSAIGYQALYWTKQNCPDIVPGKPLTKELCGKFLKEFMDRFGEIHSKLNIRMTSCSSVV